MDYYSPIFATDKETGKKYFSSQIKGGQLVFINSSRIAVGKTDEYTLKKAENWFPQMEESMKNAAIAGEVYTETSERISILEKELDALKEQKKQAEKDYHKEVLSFLKLRKIYDAAKTIKGDENYFFRSRLFASEQVGDLNTALAIALKSDRPIYHEWEEYCPTTKKKKQISKDELLSLIDEWKFRDIIINENEIVYVFVPTPTRFD